MPINCRLLKTCIRRSERCLFRQCQLGSLVREICTPGSAWGDENKGPCPLGEASAPKRLRPQGTAQAKVVKARLYQPARSVVRASGQASIARGGLSGAIHRRLVLCFQVSRGRSSCPGRVAQKTGKFDLTLEAKKTKLVEFGRFAHGRASVAVSVRKRFIFWSWRCTAPAAGKATFGLEYVQKSHDCDGRLCVYRIGCDGCGTRRFRSNRTTSIKCFAVTMHATALPRNIRALRKVHRAVECYWHKMRVTVPATRWL
jgi:hypothetical protein